MPTGPLHQLPSIYSPSMKNSITAQTIFAFATLFPGSTEAYRAPAHYRPPHVHYDYRSYHPSQSGSGHFESLNKSLIPWEALPALLSDTDLLNSETNNCSSSDQKSDTFWLSRIAHQGTSPFLSDSSEYVIYRDVKDFGAKGDGSTDDSAAFNAAITGTLTIVEFVSVDADIARQAVAVAREATVVARLVSQHWSTFLLEFTCSHLLCSF